MVSCGTLANFVALHLLFLVLSYGSPMVVLLTLLPNVSTAAGNIILVDYNPLGLERAIVLDYYQSVCLKSRRAKKLL